MCRDMIMYGVCQGCDKLIPRDDMCSANINIYGEGVYVVNERVRVRLCKKCFDREHERCDR